MVTGKTRGDRVASFNPEAFVEATKKDFQKRYGASLKNWENVWEEISKARPKKQKKKKVVESEE